MLAAVLYGKEDVRIEERTLPNLVAGEVRVRIEAALTCGTDVKVFRRGYHAKMIRPPALFGHEFAGVIDSVGPGVADWRVGDRVAAANSAPCDVCFYCLKNLPELCEDLLFLNGAYAEQINVPTRIVEKNMSVLPDSLGFQEAAMSEPLACVVRGLELMPVYANETVVVLGAGPIGLMFIRLCAAAGARVLAVGRRLDRLRLAEAMGAAEVYDTDREDDVVTALRARTEGGRGADRVIEAVGKPEIWQQAVAIARKHATVSLFGGCPSDTTFTLDTHRIHYDEITVRGTFHHTPRTFRKALSLIADGIVPARALIQDEIGLRQLPGRLMDLASGANHAVKTAVVPAA